MSSTGPVFSRTAEAAGGFQEGKNPPRFEGRKFTAIDLLNLAFTGWTSIVYLFFYIPILLLVVYSFNDSRYGIEWKGFTLRWYDALFGTNQLLAAFRNSLLVGGATTLLATALGTLGAWLLHKYRYPMARTLGALVFVPMVIPEVLMGASLLLLFVSTGVERGFLTMIIAHTTFCFPFVLIAVRARLEGIDPNLEEAALDLGATPWLAFSKVIFPYLLPAVVSGALMAFTLSLDEYIVTLFTVGAADTQTLPLAVFPLVKKGTTPMLNALSTLFIVGTVIMLHTIALVLTCRRKRYSV